MFLWPMYILIPKLIDQAQEDKIFRTEMLQKFTEFNHYPRRNFDLLM
jgi:hypothetical protein